MVEMIGRTFFVGVPMIEFLFQTPAVLQTLNYALGFFILGLTTYRLSSKELRLFLWLVYVLMTGTSQITYFTKDLTVLGILLTPAISNMLLKVVLTGIVVVGLLLFIWKMFEADDVNAWLLETWIFVKSIFPLIISGVVIAGFVKYFIPPEIIVELVGSNTILANLIGVLFGVFMYFPTLMEVPIARIFLDLGMARGPLLAYLLADPELSIQSILVTRKYLGDRRNSFYVILVTFFTTFSGLLFGFVLGQGIGLW